MKFKDKTAVITGGANGIGRCIAEAFMSEGAKVAVIDMDEKGAPCDLFFHGDIADEKTLVAFAEEVAARFGTVDYLINNACPNKGGILSGCEYENFLYVQRVGVTAPYFLSLLFKDYFSNAGSIVNISSTRAFQSQADTESYTAAKGGITALTHALAVSLSGIARVNSIAPGWIDTGSYHSDGYVPSYTEGDVMQHPSQRIGEPEDIARAVLFLCDERNSFINGENITIDGGMSKLMIYHNDYGWNYQP